MQPRLLSSLQSAVALVLVDDDYSHHQQYLAKVPNGYDCHANTGIPYPTE